MSKNPYGDMMQFMNQFKAPTMDMQKLFNMQRQQMESLSQMNAMVNENTQAIARRQAELARESIEGALSYGRDMMSNGSTQIDHAKQMQVAKTAVESSMQQTRELSEMVSKSSFELLDEMNRRANENLSAMSDLQNAA